MRIDQNRIVKIYNVFLAICPIIGIYSSGIPGVTVSELILGVFFVVAILMNPKIQLSKTNIYIIALVVYSILYTMIIILLDNSYNFYWTNRLVRFVFYMVSIIVTSNQFFDKRTYFNSMKYITVVVFAGIIIQYAMYYGAHVYIRLYGNILTVASGHYMERDYSRIFSSVGFRPSSFFLEPSHLSQTLIFPLAYFMLGDDESERKITVWQIIITITILLSTSLWGYLLLGILYIIWMVKKGLKLIYFTPVIGGLVFFLYRQQNVVRTGLNRLDFSNLSGDSTFAGRFMGYKESMDRSFIEIIFGSGFGNTLDLTYLNSILYVFIGIGIVGLVLLALVFFKSYKYSVQLSIKVCCLFFAMLLFGTSIIVSVSSVVCFSIILYSERIKEGLENNG